MAMERTGTGMLFHRPDGVLCFIPDDPLERCRLREAQRAEVQTLLAQDDAGQGHGWLLPALIEAIGTFCSLGPAAALTRE